MFCLITAAVAAIACSSTLVHAAPTAICTTVTRTANYTHAPTGTLTSYKGLTYSGWEVVRATDTPFTEGTPKNLLMLTGESGSIKSPPGHTFNINSFYFGCANGTSSAYCGLQIQFYESCGDDEGCQPPGPAFQAPFFNNDYPHSLEKIEGDEPTPAPEVVLSIYNGEGGQPADAVAYISDFSYIITNCPATN